MAVPASRILSVLGLDVATSYPSDGIFNYPVTYLPGAGVNAFSLLFKQEKENVILQKGIS